MNNEVKAKGTRIDIPNEVASMVATAQRAGFDEAKLRALEILGGASFEPKGATPEQLELIEGAVEAFRVVAYRQLSEIKSRTASFRMLETDDSDEEAAPTMCKTWADIVADRIRFAYCDEDPALVALLKRLVTALIPNTVAEMKAFNAKATQSQLEEDFKDEGIEAAQAVELACRGVRAIEDVVELGLRLKAKLDAEAAEAKEN